MKPTITIQPDVLAGDESCCAPVSGPLAFSDDEAVMMANQFKALADPTRIQILGILAGRDEPTCVCEITPRFSISQPTISHHLRILRDADFIFAERRGDCSEMWYRPSGRCSHERDAWASLYR